MYLIKDWLLEFVALPKDITDEEIARRLNVSTVEVEGVAQVKAGDWDHIVVGVITAIDPHPNADRLRVARVDCASGAPRTIVCGGSNMAVGMKVVVALPGARVCWHGEGNPLVLEKSTIRGIESDGMICSSAEVGLAGVFPAKEEHEILDISFLTGTPGTPLSEALTAETVFEIDNKSLSHRPDLWGHRGIARELSALFGAPFRDKTVPSLPSGEGHALRVEVVDSDLCARYIGIVVGGITNAPSPAWMQKRLRACGIRPIHAGVDITNYVMLEYGQPMHAFDFDAIAEKKKAQIIVRRARTNERIRALDGNDYVLSPETLIIANQSNPLAIAGVMGGIESGISADTTTVIFEAAHFAPLSVRRTAARLGLVSESSRRFEKDLDPELPGLAMARALQLCAEIFPRSRVTSPVRDVYRRRPRAKPLVVTAEALNRRLGAAIPPGRSATLLKRLGFDVRSRAQSLVVAVPSFRRTDITIPEDIFEEVLRSVGYDAVSSALPRLTLIAPREDLLREIKSHCAHAFAEQYAFREMISYAFVRPQTIRACGFSLEDHYELENPLSQERPYLCHSLLQNLLEAVERNQQKEKRLAFVEVNRVFLKDQTQPTHCAFIFSSRDESRPFAYCADAITTILARSGWRVTLCEHSPLPLFAVGRSAIIKVGDIPIGTVGHIAPLAREQLGISADVVAGEVDLSALVSLPRAFCAYQEESAFPHVVRDITLAVREARAYQEVFESLQTAHSLISSVEPFAIYRDAKIGEGKKSLSFHIVYRASDRTLTSQEVDEAHTEVIAMVKKKFNTPLR